MLSGCATSHSPTAESILGTQTDAEGTAKLTGFDYRKNLESAVRKEPKGLHALFQFTDSESFVGAGADDHCKTLYDLLHLWGDREFAHELAKENHHIRTAVIDALEYAWDYQGWTPSVYPMTYSLAKHDKVPTSPP